MNRSHSLWILVLVPALVLSGCATEAGGLNLSERETGALMGGGMGAGLGAIIGNQTGHAGAGTAIGAGAGALAGAILGEANRRQKENTKKEIREELMQQQYQTQYAPQPYNVQQPTYATQQNVPVPQEIHTKYNPRTGQTFPERYQYDPNTGEKLEYLR